ncbi:MAG: hypothetical protein KZQ65_11290 [Candidatus Thiodiazotropha sp. (ex Gloverina cf. vestifex)]|nr:hypothetical protein [Candidatus Thiodiazotropha sp. (ex Gloverina cf. vestifex)]
MSQNLISAEFSAEEQQATLAAIQQIQSLPFLIGLSNTDKRKLNKMGAKSRAFVDHALDIARQNPNMMPGSFELDEFERDANLFNGLTPINIAPSQLIELVEGTLMAVGSDAYNSALEVYAFAKMTEDVTGLEDLRSTLGSRFRSSGNRGNSEPVVELTAD